MAVIINLKEVFSTDSQSELSSKLNFNFNQLLALGIGQPGPIGPQGIQGAPGPIGPIGPQGQVGSLIYGEVPPVNATAPSPSIIPTAIVVNDVLITSDKIIKKVDTAISATGWQLIADFNSLVQNAIGSNISPYVKMTPTSRVIRPRVTSGTDLTNSAVTSDPSFPTPGVGPTYQTILYNFNETLTKSIVLSGGSIQILNNSAVTKQFSVLTDVNVSTDSISIPSHGLNSGQYVTYSAEGGGAIGGLTNFNGYFVLVVDPNSIRLCETINDVNSGIYIDFTSAGTGATLHKLIAPPSSPETIFPATSNLALYSYFNNTATPARQFDTNPSSKGYRYQIELGSIDTMPTSYTSGVTGQSYVISPSFENLRIRKYRLEYTSPIGDEANPGKYFLRAEYDLSSDGITAIPESFSPRRNSEQVWKINKSESSSSTTRSIEMKLTNSIILADTETVSGISVDGIFLKQGATFDGITGQARYFGLGFIGSSPTFNFQLSTGMSFSFNRDVNVGNTRVHTAGIDYDGAFGTTWTITGVNGNITLATLNSNSTISLNQAVVVKEDRLAQGLPFPITQVVSTDPNTLDDYEEGAWTPVLYGGALAETGTTSFKAIMDSTTGQANWLQPAGAWINNSSYVEATGIYGGPHVSTNERLIPIIVEYSRYVKIGKKVTCWINFSINPSFNWITQIYTVPGITTYTGLPGSANNRFDFLYRTNVEWWSSAAIGMTLPFPAENAPNSGATTTPFIALSGIDQLSSTVLAGSFNFQIDDSLQSGPISGGPVKPIIIEPAFYQKPFRIINGAVSSTADGTIDMNGVPGAAAYPIYPITPTSKCEIRTGYLLSEVTTGSTGSPLYTYKPGALFFAQRDWVDTGTAVAINTRSLGTSAISPVTALDCLYSATVPDSSLGVPDGVYYNKLIKFQCHFTYEAAS